MRHSTSKIARPAKDATVERLKLENDAHSLTVPTYEIEAVEGAADRMRIYRGTAVYTAIGRLAELFPRLGPAFVRVTRTMIVNAALVERCAPQPNGDVAIHFNGGRRILVGGRHAAMVLALPLLTEGSHASG
jgi:DNA-binding LytR/AlgR family response regulator